MSFDIVLDTEPQSLSTSQIMFWPSIKIFLNFLT
jgi:hypothetical protein